LTQWFVGVIGSFGLLVVQFLLTVVITAIIRADNVLRPFLIRKEADLPMLLVLTGVIGGLVAFGLVGIFVGPAVLAVSYTLLQAWLTEDEATPLARAACPRQPGPDQPATRDLPVPTPPP
jgi:predicted PurR-regulated permease PerM